MDPFIGEIIMFAGNFAPRGWAFCDGQLLPINQNSALFSILGTIYGGDGRTTFALPDLRGRVAMHPGTGAGLTPRDLGERGGTEDVVLMTSQIPAHSHNIVAVGLEGNSNAPNDHFLANTGAFDSEYSNSTSGHVYMNSGMVQNTGGTQPHTNMQPFTCINYIIALQGTYPSRS
ncbi:phage tail protein [Aureispira anguillae]|uniref:Tail fiber protein n=1 Tax=Aureispira anguillae TaxID=2864201 RepID=A0A916DUV1_9BACT|nr:tail fiber protein [Aureispira anguillae]BDS12551.1 tail fiber protein [Aureispira anguillae]